jgi:C-terminal processing protease CtpA/Prc
VDYPSPAFDAGLHVGDLIISVNGVAIEQIGRQELGQLLSPKKSLEIALGVSRLGKKMTFRVTPVTYRAALASIGRKLTKFGPAPQHCPESP